MSFNWIEIRSKYLQQQKVFFLQRLFSSSSRQSAQLPISKKQIRSQSQLENRSLHTRTPSPEPSSEQTIPSQPPKLHPSRTQPQWCLSQTPPHSCTQQDPHPRVPR